MAEGRPLVGVSWMPGPAFRAAVEPVLDDVEALETTVDHALAGVERLPPSTRHVLGVYAEAGLLFGHGVNGSAFSAGRADRFEVFLEGLRRYPWPLVDLSEHVGVSAAGRYRAGPPLPPDALAPPGLRAAAIGVAASRLARIGEVLRVPIGLENLALAFDGPGALAQGPFVTEVLAQVGGFLHLDVHNLWCQLRNFALPEEALLATWPLARVRRVHVSGGRWEDGVRRDTHDHAVPDEVWALLGRVLPRLPGCRVVVLEQLPSALGTAEAQAAWRRDLATLRAVRDAADPPVGPPAPLPAASGVAEPAADAVALLARAQAAWFEALGAATAVDGLAESLPDELRAAARAADPRLLEAARRLVATWGSVDRAGGPVATGEESG